MKRREFLRAPLGLAAGTALHARGAAPLVWRERVLTGFGTTVSLRAGHPDVELLNRALDGAVALLRRVERETSLFHPDGAVRQLNRDGFVERPSDELRDVLRAARQVAARSGGAFDVTVQPLWAVWDEARQRGALPARAVLRAARAAVGWSAVVVDANSVRLRRPGMAVTLNGIAQGYAADRARAALHAHGIEHALLDTGEWASLGEAPEGGPWRLGLADPRSSQRVLATLLADGRAVACSSDAAYSFSADHRHHHILDPRTGASPTGLAAVAVAAPSAMLADALTKVVFMGDAQAALAVARAWGVDVVVVDKRGRISASPGLRIDAA